MATIEMGASALPLASLPSTFSSFHVWSIEKVHISTNSLIPSPNHALLSALGVDLPSAAPVSVDRADRPDMAARTSGHRSIEVVEDRSAPEANRFLGVGAVLEPLTPSQLAVFRRDADQHRRSGTHRWFCGLCQKPVYLSLSGARRSSERDGRDAHFSHHAGFAKQCAWGTVGQNPSVIDAAKFNGVLEGEDHRRLKTWLAEMLTADPAYSDIAVEKVCSHAGGWRKPDVSAGWFGGQVAFDIQLATTHLPVITAREAFYHEVATCFVWLVGTDYVDRLSAQAFQDIYWNNHGQILAVDAEARDRSIATEKLHFWVYSVQPTLEHGQIVNVWQRQLLPATALKWNDTGRPYDPKRTYNVQFSKIVGQHFGEMAAALSEAVTGNDSIADLDAGRAWRTLAEQMPLPSFEEAQSDMVFRAIGVLNTAKTGEKQDASRYGWRHLDRIFEKFLQHPACRGWSRTLSLVATAYGYHGLLETETIQTRLARNRTEDHPDFGRKYALLLAILFPVLAQQLVGSVPK